MQSKIDEFLQRMVEINASDLHIKVGSRPGFRIDGEILTFGKDEPFTPDETRALAELLMGEEQARKFEADGDMDLSYAVTDLARFRINVLTQRGSVGLVIRQIPDTIPTIDSLKLPSICKDLALKPRGLVLVAGPTGSGKSTTLAAMVDYINEREHGHILTMEDPLEFIHEDKNCFVNQRQIGSDCHSFSQALRRALRQDPDVILIGEMRDLETISLAITAAETGHLVFGTLHTTSAISTIDRMIDVFPADQQDQVRVQLSTTLQGVISQCLLSKVGGGRVAAHEILIATDGVRSLIREGKTAQMMNFLQTGSKHGMKTLEMALVELVDRGQVNLDDAVAKANRPDDIAKNVRHKAGKAHAGVAPQGTARVTGTAPKRRSGSSEDLRDLYGGAGKIGRPRKSGLFGKD